MKKLIPTHVAIIPDGNRRWAKEKGLVKTAGHVKSGDYNNLFPIFEEAERLGVKCLSIWGFSTENWKRDDGEKKTIFDLVLKGAKRFREEAEKKSICFKHIGRKDRLPKKLIKELEKLEEETKDYSRMTVLLCLDYGGRDELVRAARRMVEKGEKELDEDSFADYLDSAGLPDPDLMIRTGGERRMSGFMPFQTVYSELYFTDLHFPDFGPAQLREAVEDYLERQRRFGGD